jgi:hypothetical protein
VNAPETYRKWSKKYGPVFQIMLGNEPVVVVNSAKAAHETFLSQGTAMSSRPMFYTFHKVNHLLRVVLKLGFVFHCWIYYWNFPFFGVIETPTKSGRFSTQSSQCAILRSLP